MRFSKALRPFLVLLILFGSILIFEGKAFAPDPAEIHVVYTTALSSEVEVPFFEVEHTLSHEVTHNEFLPLIDGRYLLRGSIVGRLIDVDEIMSGKGYTLLRRSGNGTYTASDGTVRQVTGRYFTKKIKVSITYKIKFHAESRIKFRRGTQGRDKAIKLTVKKANNKKIEKENFPAGYPVDKRRRARAFLGRQMDEIVAGYLRVANSQVHLLNQDDELKIASATVVGKTSFPKPISIGPNEQFHVKVIVHATPKEKKVEGAFND